MEKVSTSTKDHTVEEDLGCRLIYSKQILPFSFSNLYKKFTRLDQAIYSLSLKGRPCFLTELNKAILSYSFEKIRESDLEHILGIMPDAYEIEWDKNPRDKALDMKLAIHSNRTVATSNVKPFIIPSV